MSNLLCAETNVFSIILIVAVVVGLLAILIDSIRGIVRNVKKIKDKKKVKQQSEKDKVILLDAEQQKDIDSTIVDENK